MKELFQLLSKVGGKGAKLSDDIAETWNNASALSSRTNRSLGRAYDAWQEQTKALGKVGWRNVKDKARATKEGYIAGRDTLKKHGKSIHGDVKEFAEKHPTQARVAGLGALGVLGGGAYGAKKLLEDDEDDYYRRPYL